MNVVIDTNVFISGLLNPDGEPARVLNLFLQGKLILLHDNRIISEYEDVLKRPKFAFAPHQVGPLLEFIRSEGVHVVADPSPVVFRDKDDQAFYEVALSGGASHLITGNRRHNPPGKMVKTPSEFLHIYLRGKRARAPKQHDQT